MDALRRRYISKLNVMSSTSASIYLVKMAANNGAGMNRLLTSAAFIHSNMPLGTVWNHPAITNEDTYDVAAYLSSKERPQMSGLEKDYPKLEKKAVDCPYPPYADDFSQEQHQ